MLLTKRLACPSCSVKLRVADTLPAGKTITCPKCGSEFPVPGGTRQNGSPKAATRARKPAAPPDEDQVQDEAKARPRPRKRGKKPKQAASNTPLILGLGAVALAVAVALVVILRPWEKKTEQVASSGPSRAAPMEMRPGPRPGSPGPRQLAPRTSGGETGGEAGPGPSAQRPAVALAPTRQSPAGAESDLIAVGQNVFQANNCGRCHGMDGGSGGGRRGPRGPDLSRVGAVHSVDWLVEQIRDPQSHKPDSRMPPYADKIGEEDLRALATYLASLKG
jgi:mono/diheme cytochrome c family protein